MQLTMDQINQLASMGFSMNGVAEGSEATAEEMAALKIQPDVGPDVSDDLSAPAVTPQSVATDLAGAVPTAAPVSTPQMTPNAVSAAVQAVPAASAVTQEQLSATPAQGGSSFMDAIFGPKEGSDKFSNLNRQQRMMLAFGAIKDAGFALQGKEGNAFGNTLKAINDQIDMGRKAQAAAATREMFASLTGGSGGVSALPPNATPEEIDAHIAKLTSLLASPQGAMIQPYVTAEVARLTAMKEQSSKDKMTMVSAMQGVNAVDALLSAEDLTPLVGVTGSWNAFKNQFGAAPEYASLIMYVDQIKGLNFVDAFQDLKGAGPVTDTEGAKATAARSRIDAALKGNVADLTGALMDVRELFADALRQNPAFKGNVASAPTSTTITPEAQAIIDSLQPNSGGNP